MRVQQDVRRQRLLHEIRSFPLQPWIFMRSQVGVRPAVESVFLKMCEIVRWQIVAELITFLHGCPQRVRIRISVQTDRIPRAVGEDLVPAAIRVVPIDRGRRGSSPVSTFEAEPTPTYSLSPLRSKSSDRVQ